MSVNLRSKCSHYYKVGAYVSTAVEDDDLRKRLRAALAGERFESILDWSQNSATDDVAELTDKLTHDELVLFTAGSTASKTVANWKARRVGKLQAARVFSKRQRL